MKYLKKFENNPYKKYLVVDFSYLNKSGKSSNGIFYVLRTTENSTKYEIIYDAFYYYNDHGRFISEEDDLNIPQRYSNDDKIIILNETDSKDEALDILKMLEESKKFNV